MAAGARRIRRVARSGQLRRPRPTETPAWRAEGLRRMNDFTEQEVAAIYRVVALRRDMRHFRPDPLDEALMERLLSAAHLAPSVGFMQPWRFIRVRDRKLRHEIHTLVESERRATAKALGEREDEFMRLKVEGIRE